MKVRKFNENMREGKDKSNLKFVTSPKPKILPSPQGRPPIDKNDDGREYPGEKLRNLYDLSKKTQKSSASVMNLTSNKWKKVSIFF